MSAARECGPGVEQCERLMLGGPQGKVNAAVKLATDSSRRCSVEFFYADYFVA